MEIFLVGGAVRDKQLGLPMKEKDWCVVGSSPEELLKAGFKSVGKDFPVFLHPKTKEEYALARTEKKTGPGYHGFTFKTSKNVTLKEDLQRRDLTINAMAMDENNKIIDPYNGLKDIQRKSLRHVSIAYKEDPVRVLRTAKFAARFHQYGFDVAPETMKLMTEMAANNEIDNLVRDRVWRETEQALNGPDPHIYFNILEKCNALPRIFPELIEINKLNKAKEDKFNFQFLKSSSEQTNNSAIHFSILLCSIAQPYKNNYIQEKHEALLKKIQQRLPIPSHFIELAILLIKFNVTYNNIQNLAPEDILALLEKTDAFRRKPRFLNFTKACEILNPSKDLETNGSFIKNTLDACEALSFGEILSNESDVEEIKTKIKESRIKVIKNQISNKLPKNNP